MSLWGGFACPCVSPGGSSEACGPLLEVDVWAGRTENGCWSAAHQEHARGRAKPGGARPGQGEPRHLGQAEPGWRFWGVVHRERAGGGVNPGVALGAGVPSCALRGCHCGWECPFPALLGPHLSASSEQSGGVRTTGKGTWTQWSREPRFSPSLLAQSRSPLT